MKIKQSTIDKYKTETETKSSYASSAFNRGFEAGYKHAAINRRKKGKKK